MATPKASVGDQVVHWFGSVAAKNLEQHPEFVRHWLMTGFRAQEFKVAHVPFPDLYPSGNEGYSFFMDSIVNSLADPAHQIITSMFVPNEMFHAMGLLPATAEAVASFVSGSQAEGAFLGFAEGRGIPETYCSYHRALMGMAQSGILRPCKMLASCTVACDANNLTFKALSRLWGVPHYYVDVPEEVSEESVRYVAAQLRELGRMAQELYGTRLDEGRLTRLCLRSRQTSQLLDRTLPLRRDRYLAGTMTTDLMQMLDVHLSLGTKRCEALIRQMLDDYAKAPRFRGVKLVWAHVSPYFSPAVGQILNTNPDVQVVASDMTFDVMGFVREPMFEPARPYEFMAERLVRNCFNGSAERRVACLRQLADETDADGVVVFCHWGCKQTAGAAQLIKDQLGEAGYPTLTLDGDAVDRANNMEGQLGTRLTAFIEMLRHNKEEKDLGSSF